MSALSPVTAGERLDQLDILRGFALFGILMVNFEYFLNPIQGVVLGHSGGLQSAADAVDLAIKVLAEGKFYPLFSMLFGAGFALMYERAAERGQAFWRVYLRRLLILLAFGLIHMLLIWSGDILLTYALVALLMVLLFRGTPTSRLPKWAMVFVLLPTVTIVALAGLIALAPPEAMTEIQQQLDVELASARETVAQAASVYASGSFLEATVQRFDDMWFLLSSFLFWIPPVMGFFLIGRWLIITGRLADPARHAGFYRAALAVGLAVGLPLCIAGGWLTWDESMVVPTADLGLGVACLGVGAPALAFGYLALVVMNRHRLAWLAPAGRMALTNYLLQSLFWTWVVYGYGLGLGPVIPPALSPILVTAFFLLQVVGSRLWLERFRFGPAEWAWRSLTYLSLQPIRKAAR
ncbi:MAG: DUF418 domain-containing protein [Wenzhouxiangella sp.]|jgi:uncharacterized protein|nr:DUF418 domain-containing protein [Wenzhouxiangella sp.]